MLETLGWTSQRDVEFEPYRHDHIPGRVAAQHRGGYVLFTEQGELAAVPAGALRHDGAFPAVGDWVAARPQPDFATIHAVLPRRTSFSRKQAGDATVEQIVAANVDAVFLVAGLDGELNVRRLERYIATGWESGAQPVVVLTKADLCPDVALRLLEVAVVAIAVPVHVVSTLAGEGVDELRGYFQGNRTVALLGSSGVGKSTLVNRLAGREVLETQAVRADGKGRHTTSHRELVPLPGGGLVLDTPGMRELQLWDVGVGVGEAFDDVESAAARCRFSDCSHEREPGCGVRAALADGTLAHERWASYCKLQRELRALEVRTNQRLRAEQVRQYRIQARARRR